MITSAWKIEFITTAGTLTLLDYGNDIEAEIGPKVVQKSNTYSAIGGDWGESSAEGGSMVSMDWSVYRPHASHAALRSYCMSHAAALPHRRNGTLRVSAQDGETWDIQDATILSTAPIPIRGGIIRSLTAYTAIGGRMVPAAAITLYPGIPFEFILQNWEDLTADNWEDL